MKYEELSILEINLAIIHHTLFYILHTFNKNVRLSGERNCMWCNIA